MQLTYLLVFLCSFCYMALAHNDVPAPPPPPPKWPSHQPPPPKWPPHQPPPPQWPPQQPPPQWPPQQPPSKPPSQPPSGPGSPPGTCPKPSDEALKCLQEWACQYVIRLDLRCLLNLNGNPLLGNLISIPGVTGNSGGGGILGGILGK